jgi:hypothetical protein
MKEDALGWERCDDVESTFLAYGTQLVGIERLELLRLVA